MSLRRRHVLLGFAALPLATGVARAQTLDASQLGLATDSTEDQSAALQDALLAASEQARPLFLPAGTYFVGNLQMPSRVVVHGVPGATVLSASNELPVARIAGCVHSGFRGVSFTVAGTTGPAGVDRGLIEVEASSEIVISDCDFSGGAANGLVVRDAGARVSGCRFSGHGLAGLFALDSRAMFASGNRVTNCGSGGILVWAGTRRHDGSVVTGNIIAGIGTTNSGGQTGNGIHVFLADDVIVADNQIADCAAAAVRVNSGSNVVVAGNVVRNSGDAAIIAEFGYAGAVISANVVDGAASGILIGHPDGDGRLSSCTGNVVRNIRPAAAGNAALPFGIAASIDTVVSGNSIDKVPGIGIRVGQTAVRNVSVSGNVVTGTPTGIAVSVSADPPPGPVRLSGNVFGPASRTSWSPSMARGWSAAISPATPTAIRTSPSAAEFSRSPGDRRPAARSGAAGA